MKLSDIIVRDAIVTQLASNERDKVIAEMLDALVAAGATPAEFRDHIYQSILHRETRGSTAWGKGIAVPHFKHKSMQGLSLAIGLSGHGVEFNALDRQPVYSVFLLISPEDKPEEHLQAMEAICTNLSKETFRRFLRQAHTPDDVLTLLDEADNQLIR
ncbi:MAG: PTS sugar transporter subunit IIA [Phycisphaeraceae bacterium]|nr:PTS sugar transporter subunit IIA [Phycisphaeraceae bacterium]MCW5755466.1 PTS sugar transporter subunit IIA [Phycisphaeraceae bacterium]